MGTRLRRGTLVLAVLLTVLPCHAAEQAGGAAATAISTGPSQSEAAAGSAPASSMPNATGKPVAKRLTVQERIEVNVRRLAKGLNLDPGQQERLRQILLEQHRAVQALRNREADAGEDVAATTFAIYDQTKARIRGILNEEQQKKYSADVPRGELAPAQADLKHWMDVQEAGRRQAQAGETAK